MIDAILAVLNVAYWVSVLGTIGQLALWICLGIGAWTISASLFLYLRDRSGNSGRDTHWRSNPRIDGPDER